MANAREILYELPFGNLTDFDLENSYSTSKERIVQLMENHGLYDFIKENHFIDIFKIKISLSVLTSVKMILSA